MQIDKSILLRSELGAPQYISKCVIFTVFSVASVGILAPCLISALTPPSFLLALFLSLVIQFHD